MSPAKELVWRARHGRSKSDPIPSDANTPEKLGLTYLHPMDQYEYCTATVVVSIFQTERGV